MKEEVLYDILRSPVLTEKSSLLSSLNKYVFKVKMDATKDQVKRAVETIFKVKVKDVNNLRVKGKVKLFKRVKGVRNNYKKAVVTLADNSVIDFSLGVM